MSVHAKAWKLYPGQSHNPTRAELVLEDIELPRPTGDQLLVEPLYGCWAGNISHALDRSPVDVCRQRGEPWVVMGNVGVVRVLELGANTASAREGPGSGRGRGSNTAIDDVRPGQIMLMFCASVVDDHGYPVRALAYDAPGTMGCMATRILIRRHELIALPERTAYALPRWAAFSGPSITAWSNWRLAWGLLRLQLDADELPEPWVFGWGGGTTLAELELAHRHGCRTVQISGHDERLRLIEAAGVRPLDRRGFADLHFDERRFASELDYRRAYLASETAFLHAVEQITEGRMVNVFVDYIGKPVYRATLKALARQGIITTAGWKLGMELSHLRAAECIARHQHINTHYARYSEGRDAIAYAEAHGWLPVVDETIWSFDAIPQLAEHVDAGAGGFFHIYAINPP